MKFIWYSEFQIVGPYEKARSNSVRVPSLRHTFNSFEHQTLPCCITHEFSPENFLIIIINIIYCNLFLKTHLLDLVFSFC